MLIINVFCIWEDNMHFPPIKADQPIHSNSVQENNSIISPNNIPAPALKRLQNVLGIFGKNIQEAKSPEHLSEQLHQAIKDGNIRQCRILLTHPQINPNLIDKEGNTPLTSAIFFDRLEIFEELLSHPKINPNLEDLGGATPLNNAIFQYKRYGSATCCASTY